MKIEDFIKFLKLPPNILAAVSLVSGIILFADDELLKKLYMINFRNDYGFIVSIIFLISISILIVLLFSTILAKIKNKYDKSRLKKGKIKYLLNLDNVKVQTIKSFIKETTHTLKINQNDGLTQELLYYGIISLAGKTQPVDFGYNNEIYLSYFLQPWVIKLISEDRELKKKYLWLLMAYNTKIL